MSHNIPDEPFKTFEIQVPNTPEALEALEAFRHSLGAIGLSTNEYPDSTVTVAVDKENASPDPEIITERALAELSDELWGSEDYGLSVVDYLNLHKPDRHSSFLIHRNGHIPQLPYSMRNHDVDGIPLGVSIDASKSRYNFSDEALRRRVQFVWDVRSHGLFTMERSDKLDPATDNQEVQRLVFVPELTKEALAAYALKRGYDQHELHGTMGKMLDVINVAAGIPEEEIYERDTDDEFIDFDTLAGKMSRELPSLAKHQFNNRLKHTIGRQLASGQPYRHGEIIVEGQLTVGTKLTYGSIARSSLVALMHSSKPGYPVRPFLRQFDS